MNQVIQPLISAEGNIFQQKLANLAVSRNTEIGLILIRNF